MSRNSQIGGENRCPTCPFGRCQAQRIGGGLVDWPGLAAKQITEAAVQAWGAQVQRAEQLIGEGGSGQGPSAAHPGPDQLLDEGVGALLRRPPTATDDQVDDRGSVTKFGLEPT